MNPAPGDYFVVATTGWVAGCVRWATHSWANHCGLYVGDGLLIEGNPGGVRVGHANKYEGHHIAWSSMPLSHDERLGIVGAAQACLGIPYSYLDIAAIALKDSPLHLSLDGLVERRLNRGDRLICSQLVSRCYHVGAKIRLTGKPDNYVSPGDLADLLTGRAA